MPFNCWWVVASILRRNASPTQISLFFNVISIILVLLILNAILSKTRKQTDKYMLLNRAEVLTVYTCVSIGPGIAGVDRILVLTYSFYRACTLVGNSGAWVGLFHRYIPDWLTINDKRVMEDYYQGFLSIYHPINFGVWIPIALWWCAFILALHLVMLCISVILKKQWVESERLSYPIIQLPLEMTYPKGRFFKSPWIWVGLMIGASIDIVNGLNFLFPSVPSLGGKQYYLRRIFTDPPWNAIGWSPMAIFPFGVGLSFFIPLDLSFSCWAFWLIWRLERLIDSVMGWRALVLFPYEAEQSHGAYLGLCIFALWMSRRHLRYAVNCLFRPLQDGQTDTVFIVLPFLVSSLV